MSGVAINGSELTIQPSTLNEYYVQIQTDQESINGSMTRNRIGQKKAVNMVFTIMGPSDYTTIIDQFTTGSGVYYSNDLSSNGIWTFSGLPTFEEGNYVVGASLYRPLNVKLREI